jgi:ubiquinone/menaquinone biosynthesis C-methylase UbiE
MDISAKMLEQFDKRVKKAGYSEPHVKAVRANLLDASASSSPELQDPLLQNFDMALIGLALHHIDDVDGILGKIVERLRPGGTLVVVDLAGEALKEMPKGHGIAHSGWTEPAMREIFERLGLENWGWRLWKDTLKMPDGEKSGFIARGVKPSAS